MKYETLGGQVTRGETFAKMMDHLRERQDLCGVSPPRSDDRAD
jgi:hypothetical protein